MTKRLLLVKPPEKSELNFGAFSLAVLGASVQEVVDVSILDATDLPQHEAAAAVWDRRPNLVGITVMGTASITPACAFLRHLRATQNEDSVTIVAGGQGAAWGYADLLSAGADAVVLGEGERTFRRMLAEGVQPGAPGTACLRDGSVVVGPPQRLIEMLDLLPWPLRELVPPTSDEIHLVETSRGCPHACTFCATTRFHGRRWRPKSAQRVASEVRDLVEHHDAWVILFADDNFAADPRRVRDICDLLVEGPLPLCFAVSARADDLVRDPQVLPAMASARMARVTVGVESLDLAVASKAGKPIAAATFAEAFRRMRELGIFSIASLIVGLPGEDPASREQMVDLVLEIGPDAAQFLPFLPRPSCPTGSFQDDFLPDPGAVQDAARLSRSFASHPAARRRLAAAAQQKGVRGLFASATLERQSEEYGLPSGPAG